MAEISTEMGQPELYQNPELLQKLQTRFDGLQGECHQLTGLWEEMVG